jgi:tyrosine phenol-lyase
VENLRAVRELTREHGIKVVLDATRAAENAYFVKRREEGYADRSVAEILRETCALSAAATVSAKKDLLTNIGGFLATFDEELFEEARSLVVVYEGLHTYDGLAGRDMEAMARGIVEMVEEDYLHSRIGQVEYVGEKRGGIPIVLPLGGQAIFLDARRFFPEMPQDHFPAQTLAAEVYVDSGVRSMERGIILGRTCGASGWSTSLSIFVSSRPVSSGSEIGHHYPRRET